MSSLQIHHHAKAYGHLSQAFYRLAVGEGNIKDRMIWASEEFLKVTPSMLPEGDLRESWDNLLKDMSRLDAQGYQTAFHATIRRSRFSTVSTFAKRLSVIKTDLNNHI